MRKTQSLEKRLSNATQRSSKSQKVRRSRKERKREISGVGRNKWQTNQEFGKRPEAGVEELTPASEGIQEAPCAYSKQEQLLQAAIAYGLKEESKIPHVTV